MNMVIGSMIDLSNSLLFRAKIEPWKVICFADKIQKISLVSQCYTLILFDISELLSARAEENRRGSNRSIQTLETPQGIASSAQLNVSPSEP